MPTIVGRQRPLTLTTPCWFCNSGKRLPIQRHLLHTSSKSLENVSSSWWGNLLKWNQDKNSQDERSKEQMGEIRIRRATPSDMRVATDLLTEAFFRNHTNFITYPWEWCFTFLSLEGDFPQPPTQQLHRSPHDILIAEYVLVPKDRIANPIDTSTDRTQTILPSRSTQDDVVVVEAVGMVQLDGRRGRIPWKTQPPSKHQLKSPHLDPDLLSSSTTSIGPQFVISPQDYERPVYLCNLAVRESWRRRGIATQLIQASERLVYQEEPSYQQATHLCLKVRRNTPAVIALYEKLGYAIFQPPPTVPKGPFHNFRIEEESNDQGDNAIWWMAKSLVEDQVETNATTSDAAANQSPHAEVIDQVAKSERSATLPTSAVSSTDVLLGS